jgi:hypothetical protein
MMKMKRQLKKFFLVGSSLVVVGCANIPLPKGDACVAFPQKGYSLCYDMEKDFDENGDVKPEAKAHRVPLSLDVINKHVHFNPDSYASLKAFALKHKAKCEAVQNASH